MRLENKFWVWLHLRGATSYGTVLKQPVDKTSCDQLKNQSEAEEHRIYELVTQ